MKLKNFLTCIILSAPLIAGAQWRVPPAELLPLGQVPCLPAPGRSDTGWIPSDTFDWQITNNGAWIEWDCYKVGTPERRTYTYAATVDYWPTQLKRLTEVALAKIDLLGFVRALPYYGNVISLTDPKFTAINADRVAFFAKRLATLQAGTTPDVTVADLRKLGWRASNP